MANPTSYTEETTNPTAYTDEGPDSTGWTKETTTGTAWTPPTITFDLLMEDSTSMVTEASDQLLGTTMP